MAGKGIDYGRGLSNIDTASGIRYGVISPHSVNPDALQDIYDNGDNLAHAAAVADAKAQIVAALREVFDSLGVLPYDYRNTDGKIPKADAYLETAAGAVWDDIEQDFNDQYEEDNDSYRYEHDGYVIETSSLGLFIIRSPFYTFAAFCSPCCPGAGDLNTPRYSADDGEKTYCLGVDWFDDNECPYDVYTAVDDTCVFTHGENIEPPDAADLGEL